MQSWAAFEGQIKQVWVNH